MLFYITSYEANTRNQTVVLRLLKKIQHHQLSIRRSSLDPDTSNVHQPGALFVSQDVKERAEKAFA